MGQSGCDGIKVISRPRQGARQNDLKIEEKVLKVVNITAQGGCSCDYHIIAPPNTHINITSGTSNIVLDKMTGFLRVKMGQGSIEGNSRLKGIDIKLGQGDVKLNIQDASTF